jgi:hypothetical protein
VGRLSTSILALALGAVAAVALASCGVESTAKLLPGKTAGEITKNLDEVKQLAQSGECVGAESAAQQVSSQIDALGGVDKSLKQALREGAARLNQLVARCGEQTSEPATSETTTEAVAGKPPKKEEKPKRPKTTPGEPPTKTTTTKTTTTTTPTTTTPTTPTTPTTEGGGAPPSGGVGPGSPVGGGH